MNCSTQSIGNRGNVNMRVILDNRRFIREFWRESFCSDSRVMPNKEGGYAPNYTPTTVTDGERGFILDVDVLNSVNEGSELVPAVDRVEATYGAVEVLM